MKIEPWVPSFMRKIADIWHNDRAEGERTGMVYVYAVLTSGGIPIEVRSQKPLPYGKLLRTEQAP